jgi:hypothetical protein
VFDVPQVELDPLGPGELRATVDLRPAGDPRLDIEAVALMFVLLVELISKRRARADQRHVATNDIPELRQLVEGQPPENATHPRDARVTPIDGVAGTDLFGADDHRAHLEQLEVCAVPADTGLPIEHGTSILELYGDCREDEQRSRYQQEERREDDVGQASHRRQPKSE